MNEQITFTQFGTWTMVITIAERWWTQTPQDKCAQLFELLGYQEMCDHVDAYRDEHVPASVVEAARERFNIDGPVAAGW